MRNTTSANLDAAVLGNVSGGCKWFSSVLELYPCHVYVEGHTVILVLAILEPLFAELEYGNGSSIGCAHELDVLLEHVLIHSAYGAVVEGAYLGQLAVATEVETLTVDDDLLTYGKVGIGAGGIDTDDDAACLVLYGKLLVYVAALVVGDDAATDADAILDFNTSILGTEVVLAVFLFQLADGGIGLANAVVAIGIVARLETEVVKLVHARCGKQGHKTTE